MANASGMAQFAQGLGFDLTNALASDVVHLANLFEGPFVTVDQPEAHFENLAFAFRQAGENVAQFFLKQTVAGHVGGVFRRLVLDEVTDADIAVIPNWCVQ